MPNPTMATFHLLTLGCKINQYESQALREAWQAQGLTETDDPARAGRIVVNSCAVTQAAIRDLRKAVHRLHRDNPEAELVVTGCAAQVLAEELAEIQGISLILPQDRKQELLGPIPAKQGRAFPDFHISTYERARAVLKVQDGCSHCCTYCIVPLARGPARSRDPREAAAELRRLHASGVSEVILSGINLRQYRYRGEGKASSQDFWDLVALLDKECARLFESGRAMRLRISSLDPAQLDAKALDTLARAKTVCPHLHLSIQSGSPAVLKNMGRGHYGPQDILDAVNRLGEFWPLFGLGADLLVGFPGEDEQHHAKTLDLCRELPLSYAHVFPYSARPGTKAADMDHQVDMGVRKARAAELRKLVRRKKQAFLAGVAKQDRLHMVLQDEKGKGVCEYYAQCLLRGGSNLVERGGELISVRPVEVAEKGLVVAEIT